MPSLLVIRLHPSEPVTGDEFTNYLNSLSIAAHELSITDPDGVGPAFGTAAYFAPNLPPSPSPKPSPVPDSKTRVIQHFEIVPVAGIKNFARNLFAVATAVIEIPDALITREFRTVDARLVITRDGGEIIHKQLYYNVPVAPVSIPKSPNDFPTLTPISLHLALPARGQQLPKTAAEPLDAPVPNFAKLLSAIEQVLTAEQGDTKGIANLALEQCRHIAFEITWDPMLHPLPAPNRSLEAMYTGPQGADSDDERDRRLFEAKLLMHYVTHNSEAEHLTKFVFSVSAAIWCEQETRKATQAGFSFPIFPAAPTKEVKVILKGVETALGFEVPAAYFYAVTAVLPPQTRREERFKMALLSSEEQTVVHIEQALDEHLLIEPADVNRFQAARRLRALGSVGEAGTPEFVLARPAAAGGSAPAQGLVNNWLRFSGADLSVFWSSAPARDARGHLDLLLTAISKAHAPLIAAITDAGFGVMDVNGLAAKNTDDWERLLHSSPIALPEFTNPGTTEDRTRTFIRHLSKFFDVPKVFKTPPVPTVEPAPAFDRPADNPLDALITNYNGFSFDEWDSAKLAKTLVTVIPGDATKQGQFAEWLKCIQGVTKLALDIKPDEIRISVIEALWARGFTNSKSIEGFSFEDFKEALAGSVAYDFAEIIWKNAGAVDPHPKPEPDGFKPVNPDGSIVNCVPPAHLSPLGPVAYLHDLLLVAEESTCDHPLPAQSKKNLATVLANRRGPLGNLLATKSNLAVPIPLIDFANESLENMVAGSVSSGAVYNTASDQVGGHELSSSFHPTADAYQHDPVTMFEALPEHSTPAAPTAQQSAYNKLRSDFSACNLPYSQPLDVARTYLEQLGTSLFATKRRFIKNITEFVLDPAKETADFQKQLWRYPVRIGIAIEYLGITPEEYAVLFQNNISPLTLAAMYGFAPGVPGGTGGGLSTAVVVHLDEFLKRTCLTYCEFIELWKSKFVRFDLRGSHEEGFPDCEPCCLEEYEIRFEDPSDPAEALKRLAIFIRLWRKFQTISNARYTFTELRDICEVLGLFSGTNINPDFIRQLAAFQMFRDDFQLSLTDGTPPAAGATGADRLHLLAFWVPGASKWDWAVEHLLNQIQQYAMKRHGCRCRGPEFIKLLFSNLNSLSSLAGFDPNNPADTWHAFPTHTLRLAEILAKIYASEFGVGEILFLFTNDEHLDGDDPFPLQTSNEAHDSPLGLPDDDDENSLCTLRKKLMSVEPKAEDAERWSWSRMENALRTEFGFAPPAGNNKWLSLGQHFFPSVLAESGIAVGAPQRQYRVSLVLPTSELMWNTPPDGPFHYDATAQELWTQVPLTDEAVLAKLGRIRQLTPSEQSAVRDLYFLPRVDLVNFALIFNNFGEAEERLIQEPDEAKRWAWFQQEFARFHQRCQIIAKHLATHTACATGDSNPEGADLAKLLLKQLWADENIATNSWEKDNGQSPAVTWPSQPNGGAFAALLGLTGTGMQAEYFDAATNVRWRELRGGVDAFGPEENAFNAPIPTVLPSMGFTFSPAQLRFAAVRNGFAMANAAGGMLGGAEPFTLKWTGLLLIDSEGEYGFSAGAPTPAGEVPDFEKAEESHRWRIELSRGQRTWVLLSHEWPSEEAPAHCSKPIALKRGFYDLKIELERNPLIFDGPEDICPQATGFQLKYKGPDVGESWLAVPYDKLFQPHKDGTLQNKDATLQNRISLPGAARSFLAEHYTSTVRDIRGTYQRAFKAMLLAYRFHLSAKRISDDGQSELGYMLSHPINFTGQSYYRSGPTFITHKAEFDPNFLPLSDNYEPPSATQDQRRAASAQRRQAIFDCFWERLFDYTVMRRESGRSPEQPVWLLFHESAELHTDNPADLVRHLGIDLRHDSLVLQYYQAYAVTSADLEDDRWAVRVWHSEKWIRALLKHFYAKDIRQARPDLWASDDPSVAETAFGTTDSGNRNLTQFYRDGCIENGEPRRYKEIKHLNDGLRLRGRAALVAYLTRLSRVALPWGGFATEAKNLSELLLLDVEAGLCQRASRIEEAISAIQQFIQRARLGLEPGFVVSPDFVLAWERHFATFRTWEACERRSIYRENWIEWDELHKAKKNEAFEFLESELRRAALTIPLPGGSTTWNGAQLPTRPVITMLQHREPATLQLLNPARECCSACGMTHPALMDEYYFWIDDSSYYDEQEQVAEWGGPGADADNDWHRPGKLPGLLHWNSKSMVHLRWSRVHNGEFQQPRQSYEGVRITAGFNPQLVFKGRSGDSLQFEITGSETPIGYPPPPAGFRYDLATDEAIVLPQVVSASGPSLVGGLGSYPFFAWSDPGAPLLPPSPFSPAIAVAGHLRAHCRFEAALKWYELVYNPLMNDNTWIVCPATLQDGPAKPDHPAVAESRKCCCASDPVSDAEVKERAILLHYLDTLLLWGDALMRRNTPEAFQHARLIFDTAAKILGAMPITVVTKDGRADAPTIANFKPDCAPINPRLMCLYTGVNDRLSLIHNCMNSRRLKNGRANLDMPYFGNGETRDCCWKTTDDLCADESDWCAPQSPYRFMVLVQKALEMAGAVSGLGGALLSAFEKGDAEYLSTMRAMHERQLLNLALEVRQNQWREADWQVQALHKTKEIAVANLQYYSDLIFHGKILNETNYELAMGVSLAAYLAAQGLELIAQVLSDTPDVWTGTVGPFPVLVDQTPLVGSKGGGAFATGARISNFIGSESNTLASLLLTEAGWDRRLQEWNHQVVVLTIEIEQIERQILAADRRRDIALRELNNHEQQIENAAEVHDFLRDKFTNHELYRWLQEETAAIYYQMYEMALHCARQAERAFNFERGHTARRFVPAEIWDNLHEGLLSGERLQLAVRHMEKAYYDENIREYELTKHFSLRLHFPTAFLQLRTTGYCEVEIPEWMFDLDYPGQYMRRVKNVTMTIPCVAGPYTGVHCRLTMLSSKTRVDPRLTSPPHICCHESCQDECCKNGYQAMPDDCRIVSMYAATEAIATSSGQNDSGMFELNFRDERYLPFEFSGAISRWRIELPLENNQFDMETVSDLVLHLNFTAREGGEILRKAANECAQQNLPGAGVRFFDMKREFPEAWRRFAGAKPHGRPAKNGRPAHNGRLARELGIRLSREMFPFLPANKPIGVHRLGILFEAPGADPSANHLVEFLLGQHAGHQEEEKCECDVHSVACVADAKWPGLFHGVLEVDFDALSRSGHQDLGVFRFPTDAGEIKDIYLFCGYKVI
ncbi:MAG: insecticidal toxin complex protein [Blastocatellia bacterium AA13]|nr:MAG: insecticidal toxin complex protein [Blastocatellia bacterium AA13]